MALGTITPSAPTFHQPVFNDLLAFAGDGSYPTGGTAGFTALVKAALPDRGALEVVAVISQDCGGYTAVYDKAADKLKVYYGDNNNASDGPAIEVPNTTNLSGVTFHVLVLSK